jgi:hypothetical protein
MNHKMAGSVFVDDLISIALGNAKCRDKRPVGSIEQAGYFLRRAALNDIESDKRHVYEKLMVFVEGIHASSSF